MLISICENCDGGPRVLALAPDTPGLADLAATAAGGELDFMRSELRGIYIDALIGTVTLTGRNSLADALRDGNYDILHLITHGDFELAALTDETVSWRELARLLSQHQVRLVIAMTCDSRQFADGLLAAGTPQVVCTQGAISNDDARQFAREFYGALVRGQDVAAAVAFARSRMTPAGAALVCLLPDEEQQPSADPLLAAVQTLRREQIAWQTEMRQWRKQIEAGMTAVAGRQEDGLRSLTAAVAHLVEVLAK